MDGDWDQVPNHKKPYIPIAKAPIVVYLPLIYSAIKWS